ncbi:YigZ family protein [Flavobacteriaceae bacterium 3-367]|uniref:IMPACT family protein n=1 Tax=Eudoraea algarum TaxID=3417568 RepID=UPI00327A4F8F
MDSKKTDSYRTLARPSEVAFFKDRKSKFYGYAFPITEEDDVKPILQQLKKKHHTANHLCYAWQLGIENKGYRANDDGEPMNSAGMPIYGQIKAKELTNVLVVVVRIFGGTKLGVGGLIQAYRTTAQMVLEASPIVEKKVLRKFVLHFGYEDMDKVMRIIKQHQLEIVSQQLQTNCTYTIAVRKDKAQQIAAIFSTLHKVKVGKLD